MIEYRRIQGNHWWPLHQNTRVTPSDFEAYEVKINGVVYNEYSEGFENALAGAKMWMKLHD